MTDERKEIRDEELAAMLAGLEVEKAPASLTRRLYRIPEEHRRPKAKSGWKWPRQWSLGPLPSWAMAPALAAIPLIVLVVAVMQSRAPSAAEVEQARQELAVAFAYMDQVGLRTGAEIQDVLGRKLRHGVKEPLNEYLPFTESDTQEETS